MSRGRLILARNKYKLFSSRAKYMSIIFYVIKTFLCLNFAFKPGQVREKFETWKTKSVEFLFAQSQKCFLEIVTREVGGTSLAVEKKTRWPLMIQNTCKKKLKYFWQSAFVGQEELPFKANLKAFRDEFVSKQWPASFSHQNSLIKLCAGCSRKGFWNGWDDWEEIDAFLWWSFLDGHSVDHEMSLTAKMELSRSPWIFWKRAKWLC